MKEGPVPRRELFGLLYISLFLGLIVGAWLPINNIGELASIRILEIALLFMMIAGVITWLSSKRVAP